MGKQSWWGGPEKSVQRRYEMAIIDPENNSLHGTSFEFVEWNSLWCELEFQRRTLLERKESFQSGLHE